MKKNNNILYFGVAFLASVLGEAYVLKEMSSNIGLFVGIGVVVLASFYAFMTAYREEKQEKSEILKSIEMELSSTLENELKANREYMEQLNQELQETIHTMTDDLVEIQNETAKLIAKYNREDVRNAINVMRSDHDKVATIVVQAIEKANEEKAATAPVAAPQQPVQNTSQLNSSMIHEISNEIHMLGNRLDSTASSLAGEVRMLNRTSENIRSDLQNLKFTSAPVAAPIVQMVTQPSAEKAAEDSVAESSAAVASVAQPAPAAPVQMSEPAPATESVSEAVAVEPVSATEAAVDEVTTENLDDLLAGLDMTADIDTTTEEAVAEPVVEEEPTPATESVSEAVAAAEPAPATESVAEPTPAAEPTPVAEPAPSLDELASSDPNKQLTPAEIAAMFAAASGVGEETPKESEVATEPAPAAEPAPASEPAPVAEDGEGDLLTDAQLDDLIGNLDLGDLTEEAPADEPAAEPTPAAEPAPAAESTPAAEPAPAAEIPQEKEAKDMTVDEMQEKVGDIDLSDPNKQLSPDEIAAMFAALGN